MKELLMWSLVGMVVAFLLLNVNQLSYRAGYKAGYKTGVEALTEYVINNYEGGAGNGEKL